MIRAIIFDCFGVLYAPTSTVYFAKFPELHDELYDLNKMSDHGFVGKREYLETVARLTGVSEEETLQEFAKEYAVNQPVIDYIRNELKPRYKIALLSNIGHEWISGFFNEHQLHDLFDEVVMSSQEGITKPNPLIYERTAERLSVQPDECVMIDDRQENCDGAVKAGMRAFCFSEGATPASIRSFIEDADA